MTAIPTRWRTTFEEQLADAERRLGAAAADLARGEGQRALQATYPAVVAAATVRIWLEHPPWTKPLPAAELQRRAKQAFPNLFAAMASLDMRDVLNSPWPADAVKPYLDEARAFVAQTRQELDAWLART
jgi:hypothetical protein